MDSFLAMSTDTLQSHRCSKWRQRLALEVRVWLHQQEVDKFHQDCAFIGQENWTETPCLVYYLFLYF